MRKFKHISFGEGIKLPLPKFKKTFAIHLKDLSEEEVKEAHKIATDGNIRTPKTSSKSKSG